MNTKTQIAELDEYLRSDEQPLISGNYRFFGFINDVGEALHSFLPKSLYVGSYAITGIYALSAVYYDRQKMSDRLNNGENVNTLAIQSDKIVYTDDEKKSILQRRTINNSIWHLLATVAITPLLVIPAVKIGTKRALLKQTCLSQQMREKVLPAAVGIISIPAVVSPVDNAVTFCMNQINKDLPAEPYHWSGYWS